MVLTCLLVVLACLLFAGRPAALPAAGFDLPAALAESNLVDTAAEAVEPIEPAEVRLVQAPAPLPEPPTPMLEPPAPQGRIERPEETSDSGQTSSRTFDLQPGDEEMPTIGHKLTVQLVLLGWLLSSPAQAQEKKPDANKVEPGDAATRLDKIERQLGDLAAGLKGLKDSLDAVSKQLETYDLSLRVQKNSRDADQNTKDIAVLRQEIDRLQKELTRAQALLGKPEPRKALSPPEPVQAAPRVTSGTVELVNDWLTPISVWMDDLSYPLQPGERRLVTRTAGNVNYEVVGAGWGLIQPRRTTSVASGETLTIRIVPR